MTTKVPAMTMRWTNDTLTLSSVITQSMPTPRVLLVSKQLDMAAGTGAGRRAPLPE